VEAPAPDDSNNWIRHLRDRIERLQLANKEIHRDICGLRTNFQVSVSRLAYNVSFASHRREIKILMLKERLSYTLLISRGSRYHCKGYIAKIQELVEIYVLY